jgi:hypothetical protein
VNIGWRQVQVFFHTHDDIGYASPSKENVVDALLKEVKGNSTAFRKAGLWVNIDQKYFPATLS